MISHMISVFFLQQYLQAFFQTHTDDRLIGRYASSCLQTMRLTKVSARKFPPSTIEIAVSALLGAVSSHSSRDNLLPPLSLLSHRLSET